MAICPKVWTRKSGRTSFRFRSSFWEKIAREHSKSLDISELQYRKNTMPKCRVLHQQLTLMKLCPFSQKEL